MDPRTVAVFDPAMLRVGVDLRRQGIEPSREEWVCVRRGVWVPSTVWQTWGLDERHPALTHATLISAREPDQLVLAARVGPSRYIRPRQGRPVSPVRRDGVLVTPVARTVIDLACTGSLDTALAAADNALARRLCSRDDLFEEYDALPTGARGRGRARLITDLADPLSGSG